MWPALIFLALVAVVIADSLWKERRLRRQRQQARDEFTVRLLEQQRERLRPCSSPAARFVRQHDGRRGLA